MSGAKDTNAAKTKRSNRIVAAVCLAFFGGMIGAAYASVPLYRIFCQVTGYGGTVRVAEHQYSDKILDRTITVRFDTNVTDGIPWDFQPVDREVTMKIGETVQADFRATNRLDKTISGRATFNVSPELAGPYFNKVECFCFSDTTLKPGETLVMPVVFYVDPAIVDQPETKDIRTITLSYTFFPTPEKNPAAADAAGDQPTTDGKLGGRDG